MEIEVRQQLMQLLLAFAVGFVLGVVYDFFRVLRRRSGREALPDALFAVVLCGSLFTLGMSIGDGALGWGMLLFAGLGFAFYMLTVSTVVVKLLTKLLKALEQLVKTCLKPFKLAGILLKKIIKNLFSKIRKRFTMVKKVYGEKHEKEKSIHSCAARHRRDAVRGNKPCGSDERDEGCRRNDCGTAAGNRSRRK